MYPESRTYKVDEKCIVYVRLQFAAFHRWINAPELVAFLRDYHRHIFHVTAAVNVAGTDREIEFFTLKGELEKYLREEFEGRDFDYSCEQLAGKIGSWLLWKNYLPHSVEVSEDNENGSVVMYGYKLLDA